MRELLDLVEANKCDEAYQKSEPVVTRVRTEDAFRIGIKILYKLIDRKTSFHLKLFCLWFKYCIETDQKLLSKNNIVQYALVYVKNLILKQLYNDAYLILDRIYDFYEQNTKYAQDTDGLKHIRCCSSLTSSESSRILTNKQTTLDYLEIAHNSLKLAEYSFKFNLKLKYGLQLASDYLQNYYLHILKYVQSINDNKNKDVKQKLNEFHKNIIEILDKNETKSKQHDEISLLLIVNMFNFVYLNGFNECKSNLNEIFDAKYKQSSKDIPKTKLITTSSKMIKTKNLYDQLVGLFTKIVEYSNMLKLPAKSTTLKTTSKFELQLESDFFAINLSSSQTTTNLILIFIQLIELIFNYNKSFLNESSIYSKFLQESLFSLFAKAVPLHAKLIQTLYNLQIDTNQENINTQSDDDCQINELTSANINKSIKYLFYKPFSEYYSVEKMFEYNFKSVNVTNGIQSKLNMDLCERLLKSHLNYIDWLQMINVFSADEICKLYHQLENVSIKISAQFFAENLLSESIVYQLISFNVTKKKLRELQKTNNVDLNTKTDLKNLFYVAENLLLSYRHRDKYVEASESLRELYVLLKELNIDLKNCELIVLNWCKLKRDIAKTNSLHIEKNEELKKLKYTSMTDYYNLDKDRVFSYLFEELRCLKNISLNDNQLKFNDEIFSVLESLENYLRDDDVLILGEKCRSDLGSLDKSTSENDELIVVEKCRWYLEVAQFKLSKEDYSPPLHSRSQIPSLSVSNCLENSENLIKVFKSSSPKTKLSLKIINFQVAIFRFLIAYSESRDKIANSMRNLNKLRQKVKNNTQTNVDNLQLIASNQSTQYLLCNDFDSEQAKNDVFKQLEDCYAKLEEIKDYKLLSDEFFVSIRKQFYGYLDLLAQLNGFFCMPMRKMHILKIKYRLLKDEYKTLNDPLVDVSKSTDTQFDATQFALTALNLMKSYLSLHLFKQFDEINEFLIGDEIKKLKNQQTDEKQNVNYLSLIEKQKMFQNKSDLIVYYYLIQAHYFILKQNYSSAVKIIKSKIVSSSILSGRQTCAHYETKYYLRYLQFLLSTMSINQSEVQKALNTINFEDTPLSLLEECYQAIFSVARFHVQNCIEPNRVFGSSSNEEIKFFNIGSAECYRILSENLDTMQLICKYYVELSRYREATCFIREGIDLSQLHFCKRRLTHYLLHQINADLIASSFEDATGRLKLAEKFLNQSESTTLDDILHLKNSIHFYLLQIINSIKKGNIQECMDLMENKINKLKDSKALIQASPTVSKSTENAAFYNELFIEIYLNLCNAVKALGNRRESKSKSLDISNTLKQLLIDTKTTTLIFEKWYLAEYFCLLYENEVLPSRNKIIHLTNSYDLIKFNPQPHLYRRICIHLFNHYNSKLIKEESEKDFNIKIGYLLETQAIALRHKACSIHIKSKKKSLIDPKLYEQITTLLGFNSFTLETFYNEYVPKNLPNDWCVVSFVLLENMDLYLIRLEKEENSLIKIKYNQKFIDSFKEIITDNDLSMKESEKARFWSFRNAINTRLIQFLSDLEENVFSFAKIYLFGSYLTKHQNEIQNEIDIFVARLKLKGLTRIQRQSISLLFNYGDFSNKKLIQETLEYAKFNEDQIEYCLDYFKQNADRLGEQFSTFKRKHVVFLIDKNLHQVPWECLPCLKQQKITRMPSIRFLLCHIKTASFKIDKQKGYYIVDPGGDLAHTKAKFQAFMEAQSTWKGIVGIAPTEAQYKTALIDYDLFIYTGHGSGGQYYPSEDVQKLRVRACSILMGCSSGNQYVMGDFEPYGTILAYIMAGCPCIVGNLWDVTDRDIDKFTEEFLNSWLQSTCKENRELDDNICVHLNKARNICKMSHLNGAAPVIYGLPVYFK